MAPLLQRLYDQIDRTPDPDARAELIAQVGCYMARAGEFETAEAIRQELRRDYGDGRSAAVTIRVMCLEALQLFFGALRPDARDRLLRAQLLSSATKHHQLVALTSAWLAHIDFNQQRFESMVRSLRDCTRSLSADDGHAECRMSVVLGDAFLFCGDEPMARHWHEQARRLASNLGDRATFAALTYNRAALRVTNARLKAVTQEVVPSELSLLDMEVRSACNFQRSAEFKSLDHLLASAVSSVAFLKGDHTAVLREVEPLLSMDDVPTDSAQQLILLVDQQWALSQTGDRSAAEVLDEVRSLAGKVENVPADDRAICLASLAATSRHLGAVELERELLERAQAALAEHQGTIQRLSDALAEWRPDV